MTQDEHDARYAEDTANEVIFWKGAFAQCIMDNTDNGSITSDVALYVGCDMVGQAIMHMHLDVPNNVSLEELIEMAKNTVEAAIRNHISYASQGRKHS